MISLKQEWQGLGGNKILECLSSYLTKGHDYRVFSLADGFLLCFVFYLSQEQGVKNLPRITVAKVFER